ncbi:GNAT family N-acetyltransferase [Polymorphum gilvum]|uniref:Probable acetyltransferase protein n=1 Tax=Polymorphum gilvum (strain LMG 25793 / CGMCC 1.9160 / SL003B-26A1) TaxID=991905 RepID=F2J018_POLGS|nr:GNAT family N-acetyltransferase [Polymorphum gilvum]ADZ71853.1 Probable acetyltransferase protein [Polymorphum gilvum SL003B-26A1]
MQTASGLSWSLSRLTADALEASVDDLGTLLHACVLAGASVGFVLPFPPEAAAAFWRTKVLPGVARGGTVLLVAREAGRLVGTVQLDADTPANQPHRAEVRKLLVHPDARRRGLARTLMAAIEAEARALGRSLLTLDTRTGDAAEPLYASMGYSTAGVIPGYCLDVDRTHLDATTVMYKGI